MQGCQSHYVVVNLKEEPYTERDRENSEKMYDELVIEQEAQVVPIFMLKLYSKNRHIEEIPSEPASIRLKKTKSTKKPQELTHLLVN